jgi:hypothetical protein
MLRYESTFTGEDFEGSSITAEENIELDQIIEADETEMVVSYFAYIPKIIPDDLLTDIAVNVMNITPSMKYGNI